MSEDNRAEHDRSTGSLIQSGQSLSSVGSQLSQAKRLVLDWLFPPQCLGCGASVANHPGLCTSCWRQLRFISDPVCPILGVPLEADLGEGGVSALAIAEPPDYDHARAAVAYGELPSQLVSRFKYGGRTELVAFFAQMMGPALRSLASDGSVLVPVPLHPSRQRARKYNQAALLAKALSKRYDLPVSYSLLTRSKPTRQQVGLSGRQRRTNVSGAFEVNLEALGSLKSSSIILVDDVVTTSSTANAASRALRRAGVERICVLSFARVVPNSESDAALSVYDLE